MVLQGGGQGVGAAVAMGFDHVMQMWGPDDLVAVMAGDAQMDAGDLLPLCRHLLSSQADVVKGNRLAHAEVRQSMPFLRRLANRGLAVLTTLASGRRVRDAQCGFIVARNEVFQHTKDDPVWPGYGYVNHRYIRWSRHGLRVVAYPVRPVYAEETSGIHAFRFFFSVGAMFVREHHARAFASLGSGRGPLALSAALLCYLAGWASVFAVSTGSLAAPWLAALPVAWAVAHALDRCVHAGGRARI